MAYPTPSEYQEALQHPALAFADDALKTATPRPGPLGLPRPVTGAFAAVFPMTTPEGRTVAAKCFLAEADDQQARYRAVAARLAEANLPYTIAFDYQPAGIRVGGTAFPLLKMEWAEGVPLNRFVEAHLDAPGTLSTLADAWARMIADLEAAGVAHGDLQHGNILVKEGNEGPSLTLVDYDTTFVPALEGKKSAEVGHRNYQHPDRIEDDFGPYLDRFAALAIYVALRALAARPGLWEKYDTGENVLFRAADFYDPGASALFAELGEIDEIEREGAVLRAACHQAPEDVPALHDVRSGAAPVEALPERGRRRRQRRAAREGPARWFAPALGAVLGVGVALAVAGLGLAASFVLLVGAGVGAALAARGYRRQPIVRRRRRLGQEAGRFSERIDTLRREERTLGEQRDDVQARRTERRAERLNEVRDAALRERLKHHFIGEVRSVEGLSHKTVVRLKAAGIRTAYEATPEALAGVTRLGEKSKARLRMWRASLAERYAEAQPDALSPAQERRLERRAERRTEQIDAEAARTRRKIETQAAERADVEARADALPALSVARYVRYLLRLDDALPAPEEAPAPVPTRPNEGARAMPERSTPETDAPVEDGPWYESSEKRPG